MLRMVRTLQNGYEGEYEVLLESKEGFKRIREHKFCGTKIAYKKIHFLLIVQ